MAVRTGVGAVTISDVIDGDHGIDGYNTAVVYLYQRKATQPAGPTAQTTYTFSSSSLSAPNNSWVRTIGELTTSGDPIWVIAATAASRTNSYNIPWTAWSDAVELANNGSDGAAGAPGINSATVVVYKRTSSSTAPTDKPTSNLTYTFNGGGWNITNLGNAWNKLAPTSGGKYLWMRTATAANTTPTDLVETTEWAGAQLVSIDGDNGAPGINAATLTVYKRTSSATAPADKPSLNVTYTFSSANWDITNLGNGWTKDAPSSGEKYLWERKGVAKGTGTTDVVEPADWGNAQRVSVDGDDGMLPEPSGSAGFYSDSTHLGFHNGSTWQTYIDQNGKLWLSGSNTANSLFFDGSDLRLTGQGNFEGGLWADYNSGYIGIGRNEATGSSQVGVRMGSGLNGGITINGGGIRTFGYTEHDSGSWVFRNSTNKKTWFIGSNALSNEAPIRAVNDGGGDIQTWQTGTGSNDIKSRILNSGAFSGPTSSIKTKNVMERRTSTLDRVCAVAAKGEVLFSRKTGASIELGFIAEEVEPHFPQVVIYNTDGTLFGMQYDQMIPALYVAVKELKDKNDDLQTQIDDLTQRLEALENA